MNEKKKAPQEEIHTVNVQAQNLIRLFSKHRQKVGSPQKEQLLLQTLGIRMEKETNEFIYVDFASSRLKPFRNRVIPISRVEEMIRKCGSFDCYTTYMRFNREMFNHMKSMEEKTGKPTVAGYRGQACSAYLPFDLDSEDLNRAQETAKKLVENLLEWGVHRETILVYFSSSAGFHVMLDARAFGGAEPLGKLHRIFANMRSIIAEEAALDMESVDLSIKDKLRLWRIPNTRSRKSGLYKIQLGMEDLFRLSPQQIKQRAESPKPVFHSDRSGLISSVKEIRTIGRIRSMWKEAIRETINSQDNETMKPARDRMSNHEFSKIFCPAEQEIAKNTIMKGMRNECGIRLASKLRAEGFTKEAAESFIWKWGLSNRIGLPARERSSIVNSAYYPDRNYRYACKDQILKKFCPFSDKSDCDRLRKFQIKRIFE